jgi:molybdopterin-guanine dinucleotide biosynthesis protein B
MNRIHIVGRQNHGKTTLVVELVEELMRRGIRVGTIKHSSHSHELDTPGKDSHRQRIAGASPAAIVTADLIGVYVPRRNASDFYAQLEPMFVDCELVLVEGHIDGQALKIEVWRQDVGGPCLALDRGDIAAVVSDDPLDLEIPVWPRSNIGRLADKILTVAQQTS